MMCKGLYLDISQICDFFFKTHLQLVKHVLEYLQDPLFEDLQNPFFVFQDSTQVPAWVFQDTLQNPCQFFQESSSGSFRIPWRILPVSSRIPT